ncbi:MAG: toll/interleukin-1 receptor domain-containing protein [bacterium]|nr:toll/interleukin-1 receptor domain-containing protein [bacterium]
MSGFDAFLNKVLERPMPNSSIGRIRTLAKELAEGAAEEIWPSYLSVNAGRSGPGEEPSSYVYRYDFDDANLLQYIKRRWNDEHPKMSLLADNGYVEIDFNNRYIAGYKLTRESFALLDDVEPATIFISYRRRESSALALLVLARLKEVGLNAFVDLTIEPGQDWQQHLKQQIFQRDYFVLLLGPNSLTSEVVHQEIAWALESKSVILPLWHNGFVYESGKTVVSPEIDRMLTTTHTIRVMEESALAYNNALTELLNRFGVTP